MNLTTASITELRALASRVGKGQWEKSRKGGMTQAQARRAAVAEIATELGARPADVEAALARHRHLARAAKGEAKPDTITDLYRRWASDNDVIASDAELAHFTGKTTAAFDYARRQIPGVEFERLDDGRWRVTRLPEPDRTFTAEEVRAIVVAALQMAGVAGR